MKRLFVMFCVFCLTVGCYQPEIPQQNQVDEPQLTLTLFTNLPNRKSGQGLVEQTIIDAYMSENHNTAIQIEALQDEPYKVKFQAYLAENNLPDIVSVWGQPAFLDPAINSGFLAELELTDIDDYSFLPESMEGFQRDGKLYGLPRTTDVMVFYYNRRVFAEYGVSVPSDFDNMLEAGDVLRSHGIIPCALNGKDMWPVCILYTDIVLKLTGDNTLLSRTIHSETLSFSGEQSLIDAARIIERMAVSGFFGNGATSTDSEIARDMFLSGKAAMLYTGSWEMGILLDEALGKLPTDDIGIFSFPVIKGGVGQVSDIAAWNGGGYSVSADSAEKERAIAFLKYMFMPEHWAKNAWQRGVYIPAQQYGEFLTGAEANIQYDLTAILNQSTNKSGVTMSNLKAPSFKAHSESLSQQLLAGLLTPEEYLAALDVAKNK